MPSFMVKQATSRAVQPMMPMTVVSMRPLSLSTFLTMEREKRLSFLYMPQRSKNILPPFDGTSPRSSSVAGSFTSFEQVKKVAARKTAMQMTADMRAVLQTKTIEASLKVNFGMKM